MNGFMSTGSIPPGCSPFALPRATAPNTAAGAEALAGASAPCSMRDVSRRSVVRTLRLALPLVPGEAVAREHLVRGVDVGRRVEGRVARVRRREPGAVEELEDARGAAAGVVGVR